MCPRVEVLNSPCAVVTALPTAEDSSHFRHPAPLLAVRSVQDPFEKVTGSVGGRWEKPKEGSDVGTHKPVVSTWGVFERPKDMSKAFGGGRDPTLKRLDPEEKRRRDEETKAILNRWDRYTCRS